MTERPDFEALRRQRNAEAEDIIRKLWARLGGDPDQAPVSTFDPEACYCACPDGPCEHDFQGWREFEDGCGGEQVCDRCGTGAMSHSMRVAP